MDGSGAELDDVIDEDEDFRVLQFLDFERERERERDITENGLKS